MGRRDTVDQDDTKDQVSLLKNDYHLEISGRIKQPTQERQSLTLLRRQELTLTLRRLPEMFAHIKNLEIKFTEHGRYSIFLRGGDV